MIIIFAVYFDMEQDFPDAYTLHEHIAKLLIVGNPFADYLACEVTQSEWDNLGADRLKNKQKEQVQG